jgi:L-asparaginase
MIHFLNGTYNYSLADGHHIDPRTIFGSGEGSIWHDTSLSKMADPLSLRKILQGIYDDTRRVSHLLLGTDNLEEVAYLVSLTAPKSKTVILTGAMRPFGHPDYDGLDNFLHATSLALDESILDNGSGSLVVMNGHGHDGTTVRKEHSTSMAAFTSPSGPSLRWAEGGWMKLKALERRHPVTDISRVRLDAQIPILTSSLFDSMDILRLDHIDGLVVAGAGTGSLSVVTRKRLAAIASQKPVVISTRCYGGPNYHNEMYPGSREAYEAEGFLLRGYENLNPLQARLRLMAVLGETGGYKNTGYSAAR